MTSVAVVIPAFRADRWLAETIESVLAQSLPADEVVVVDDGSPDRTAEIAASFGSAITLHRQSNAGVAAARNAGVQLTGSTFLAFLDADDVWLPEKLERQVQRFAAEPEASLVHVGVEEVDDRGRHLRTRLDGASGDVAADLLLGRTAMLGGGSGAMMRRVLFDEVGGFDERLSTSADWDLYRRLARRGPVSFVAEPLLRYRLHDANMHRNVDVLEHDKLTALAAAVGPGSSMEERALTAEAFANAHLMLAGSYLHAGGRLKVWRHLVAAGRARPATAVQALGMPARYLRRQIRRS